MRTQCFRLFAGLAMILGLGGCAGTDQSSNKDNADLPVSIVYTVTVIPADAMITADALVKKQIPLSKLPKDALTSPIFAVGRKASEGIAAGELLCQHHLSAKGLNDDEQRRAAIEMKAAKEKWPESL